MSQIDLLRAVIEPVVVEENFELWGVEYQSGNNNALLRVYIDALDGVNVDDCASISRQLSVVLDTEDLIKTEYKLEVSSPGMARPFFSIEQYVDYIGHTVKVRLRSSYEGRRQLKGILSLVDLDKQEIGVVEESTEHLLPYEIVDRAQLLPVFD